MTSWADIDETVNEPSSVASPSKPVSKYVPPHLRKAEAEKKPVAKKETTSWEFQAPATSRPAPKSFDQPKDRKPFGREDSKGWGKADDDKEDRKYQSKSPYSKGFGGDSHWGKQKWDNPRWAPEEPNPFDEETKSEDTPKIDFEKYDEIPVETSGKECPEPISSWIDVAIHEILLGNIKNAKYDRPTPVQKYAIPIVVKGRDLMGCAQTGSGKTAAFLFPVISLLLQGGPPTLTDDLAKRKFVTPSALILAPTRELACQIYDEARKFTWKSGMRCCVVYGGTPIGPQLRELDRGCDILVATPGRLVDILDRKHLILSFIRFLILDEADRMLDMGFEPQIRHIVEDQGMPGAGKRQTLMFSATFPKAIQKLAASFLENYIFLAVGRVGSTTDLVTQKFVQVKHESEKEGMLLDLISSVSGLTIIFVETKKRADQLEHFLIGEGFAATSIHGDRAQYDRTEALKSFSTGKTPYLIATNVAARGLDIDNIAHVINFEMPTDIDDYVHRIGRTGRAGKPGLATAFISDDNINIITKLVDILEESQQSVPDWLVSFKSPSKYGYGHRGGSRGGFSTPSRFGPGAKSPSPHHGGGGYGRNDHFSPSSAKSPFGGSKYAPSTSPTKPKYGGRDFRFEKDEDPALPSQGGSQTAPWKPKPTSSAWGAPKAEAPKSQEAAPSFWD